MRITHRDRVLLSHISEYGMLTTKQINKKIFGGIANTTVLRRLRSLEEAKLIKRLIGLESQETLWIILEKALNEMEGGNFYKRYWNKNLLEHDFKLLSLRLLLEGEGIAKSWEPEHKIRFLIFQKYNEVEAKKKIIPDGLMITETQFKRVSVAIELELTLKNKERIKEVLNRYKDKKDLDVLWYVCGSKMVANGIINAWNSIKLGSTLRLKVSLLNDVLNNPTAHWPAQRVSNSQVEQKSVIGDLSAQNSNRVGISFPPPQIASSTDSLSTT